MVARLNSAGEIVTEGSHIQIGGEQYKVYCVSTSESLQA